MEDDKARLCEETSRGRTIVAGATHALARINLEASSAALMLAGCLLTLLVIAITLVPAIRAFDSSRCRSDDGRTTNNVYFVRHEDRRWTLEEICRIEVAARRYPQFHIFMVNLRGKDEGEEVNDAYFEELFGDDVSMGVRKSKDEVDPRLRLLEIPNVRNVDVGVAKFFAGSILSQAIGNATSEQIELAAKFHVIWNSSGISLEPRNIAQLESVLYFFDDQTDTAASLQIDEDLQAASVSCQSFIGLIMGEMARDFEDRRSIVTRVIDSICPRFSRCAGVRIIEAKPVQAVELAECPIVRSCIVDDNQSL